MSLHYFHCTDGRDLVIDRTGRTLGRHDRIETVAQRVARDLIAALPAFDEWDGWAVHVYDERGQVGIVPFRTPKAVLRRGGETGRTRPRRLAQAA